MNPNPNSLLIWFPKVAALKLPHPRTEIVDVGWRALQGLLERQPLQPHELAAIYAAANRLRYPLFMRTNITAAKHHWKDTCYVTSQGDLIHQLANLVDIEGCLDIRGEPSRAVVLREYVPLHAPFRAFRGLPIGVERRYFAEGGKVICHHPYWQADAIEKGFSVDPLPPDWRTRLLAISGEPPEQVQLLTTYAEAVSATLPGAWSVDFAQTNTGRWLLIDMATAAESWHPETCPNARKEPQSA